jgi:hypothetical protein
MSQLKIEACRGWGLASHQANMHGDKGWDNIK